ncbi:putative aldo/keto reductase [Gordonia hirsuta DSM 44140 = NBRC 16056]|uniref:Putative aldo/keto reductase n=1 Tax=Gordonia hirsuta DSM 44140 = NBRC 16056 TaxID=1121927 RepID=L7LEF1_9ACTN|nr:aldo/keto reductase [Gordonia hirsuta]GAC58447.1 putative aldo/keto reductase [Gordonia hirsuta DSM 44140 = NBRC 16056]
MTSVPQLLLNNGRTIPQLGFGVFQIEPAATKAAVLAALEVGYRHIDTAQMYGNEREVGAAIAESGIAREEIFVTSKLNNNAHASDAARAATARSVEALGGPMDLYLVHWPMPRFDDYVDTWRLMEEFAAAGATRSIGVSNFQIPHLERILAETSTVPAVNQIEVHPYLRQDRLRAFDTEHQILTQAWSPISQGQVLDDPVLLALAAETGRTVAQVVLRWHIQRGDIVFPKSVDPVRMAENFDIFDFQLTDHQMSLIDGLNKDRRRGPDPDEFHWIPD